MPDKLHMSIITLAHSVGYKGRPKKGRMVRNQAPAKSMCKAIHVLCKDLADGWPGLLARLSICWARF